MMALVLTDCVEVAPLFDHCRWSSACSKIFKEFFTISEEKAGVSSFSAFQSFVLVHWCHGRNATVSMLNVLLQSAAATDSADRRQLTIGFSEI
jgi:hypothetical protein